MVKSILMCGSEKCNSWDGCENTEYMGEEYIKDTWARGKARNMENKEESELREL